MLWFEHAGFVLIDKFRSIGEQTNAFRGANDTMHGTADETRGATARFRRQDRRLYARNVRGKSRDSDCAFALGDLFDQALAHMRFRTRMPLDEHIGAVAH